jgi:transcriptional regulator with XRE-family HTH domain
LNETLRRALMHARLSEEDVAAHLQVDPKTVRRWLEGRTPYLRHRWALAALLELDEADLWPQLRTARSRSDEVRAIYPHSGNIPRKVWLEFFQSAQQEIDILVDSEPLPADDRGILDLLLDRIEVRVKLLVCLVGQPYFVT